MVDPFSVWIGQAGVTEWLTNLSGIVATFLLGLVIVGFRRYIKRPRLAPIDFIATGIWVLALVQLLRLLWWDVVPDFFPYFERWGDIGVRGHQINWLFNLGNTCGTLFMLRGYHKLVEEKAPGRYNILTAVFYPRRLRLWIQTRENGDD